MSKVHNLQRSTQNICYIQFRSFHRILSNSHSENERKSQLILINDFFLSHFSFKIKKNTAFLIKRPQIHFQYVRSYINLEIFLLNTEKSKLLISEHFGISKYSIIFYSERKFVFQHKYIFALKESQNAYSEKDSYVIKIPQPYQL